MLFFKPHVNFPLNFASPFSVMTQNSSEIFHLKYMLSTKQAHQCTIFQTYECSILWNFTHFLILSLFSVMKVNSSLFFKLKSQLLWKKITYRSEIFELLSSWVKFTKSLMSYLKPQISFSLKFTSPFNVMRDNSSVLFQLELYIIFREMSTTQVKFYQICTFIGSFCRKYIEFQLIRYRGVMSRDTEDW